MIAPRRDAVGALTRWLGFALVVALTGAGTAGCSGDRTGVPSIAASQRVAAAEQLRAEVPLQVEMGEVAGGLGKSRRATVKRSIAKTVSSYLDNAFLSGSRLGREPDAFAAFSRGAAREARRDRELLSNAALSRSTRAVVAKRKAVTLSVLAPRRSVAGVSARLRLVYVADGPQLRRTRVKVSGRLLLSRERPGGWQIFGYEVARSAVPVGRGAGR